MRRTHAMFFKGPEEARGDETKMKTFFWNAKQVTRTKAGRSNQKWFRTFVQILTTYFLKRLCSQYDFQTYDVNCETSPDISMTVERSLKPECVRTLACMLFVPRNEILGRA